MVWRVQLVANPQAIQTISATAASYTAGGGAIFLGMNVEQWGITSIIIGIFFIFLTYATNVYFQRKKHKQN